MTSTFNPVFAEPRLKAEVQAGTPERRGCQGNRIWRGTPQAMSREATLFQREAALTDTLHVMVALVRAFTPSWAAEGVDIRNKHRA